MAALSNGDGCGSVPPKGLECRADHLLYQPTRTDRTEPTAEVGDGEAVEVDGGRAQQADLVEGRPLVRTVEPRPFLRGQADASQEVEERRTQRVGQR
jgi:hypothetical protein